MSDMSDTDSNLNDLDVDDSDIDDLNMDDSENEIENDLNSLLIHGNIIQEYENNILTMLNSIHNKLSDKILVKYKDDVVDFSEILENIHNDMIKNHMDDEITFGQLLSNVLDSLEFK